MTARAMRYPANFDVVLRQGPQLYPSTICNISVGGACLMGAEWLNKGDTMVLDYARGQTKATVTWKTGRMAGVRFDEHLSKSGLDAIRMEGRPLRQT